MAQELEWHESHLDDQVRHLVEEVLVLVDEVKKIFHTIDKILSQSYNWDSIFYKNKMDLREHLLQRRAKILLHMTEWISYRTAPITIDISIYNKLIECQKNYVEIMRYIYENRAIELLEYHQIKEVRLSNFIQKLIQENKPAFDDHNFISRWDYFFTKQWMQVAEVNQDTPWWWIEAMYLSKLPESEINDNFLEKFSNFYIQKWYKFMFLATWIGDRWDRKMIEMLSEVLKRNWIDNHVWLFEWLNRDEDWFLYKWKRVDAIHKDLPIDWVYKQYSQETVDALERFMIEWKIDMLNHPIWYIFQLKTYYAYLREHLSTFPKEIQRMIKMHIPETHRLVDEWFPLDYVRKNRKKFVLKNINNRLSQDVYIWVDVKEKDRNDLLNAHKSNSYRIAQKYFDVILLWKLYINFGMYTIWMKPADMYLRVNNQKAKIAIEYTAPYKIDSSITFWSRLLRWLLG
jgi:glutathionylspermidine synthase